MKIVGLAAVVLLTSSRSYALLGPELDPGLTATGMAALAGCLLLIFGGRGR